MIVNDTRNYHKTKPPDMSQEMTFSLTFTVNFDQLYSNLSYGRKLFDELIKKRYFGGEIPKRKLNILEIGPGNGMPTYDFLIDFSREHQNYEYTAIDMAPNLLKVNVLHDLKSKGFPIRFIEGDAHEITDIVGKDTADIIIANEMIGDLITVAEIPRKYMGSREYDGELDRKSLKHIENLREMVSKYDLRHENTSKVSYNLGAMKLVDDLPKIMREGSIGFISEHSCEQPVPGDNTKSESTFYGPGNVPRPINLGDPGDSHTEYTVRFSDLVKIGKENGLETERGKLVDLIDIKKDAIFLPYHTQGEELIKRGIEAMDFYQKVVAHNEDLFPDFARVPQIAYCYISAHPELLRPILKLDAEGEENIMKKSFNTKDFFGQMEYLILNKNKHVHTE